MKSLTLSIVLACLLYTPFESAIAAQVQSVTCTPIEVAVIYKRLHVKCKGSKPWMKDIPYYAMNLSEGTVKVNAIMQILTQAKANGRKLRVWVDMADYKSVPGCKGSNCRRLVGAALL